MTLQANSVSDAGSSPRAQRRRFMRMQAAKAGLGALLGLAFFVTIGRPDTAELFALSGFMIARPAWRCWHWRRFRFRCWSRSGLAGFAGLIGYLAILTGGVVSPLVVWLVLVPAEAALTGRAVCRAARRPGRGRGLSGRGGYRSDGLASRFTPHLAAVGGLCLLRAGGLDAGGADRRRRPGPAARRRRRRRRRARPCIASWPTTPWT